MIYTLRFDGPATLRAMAASNPRKQHSQQVVDLGNRADSGPGIVTGSFLLNANGWGQPTEIVHIGLVQLAKKLPRIT
ncbi:hypothetical protein HRbin36_01918 [bacterium HR36]|nr:hypothetical protein HRbin36_01918 [bacterium HR36]